MPVSKWIFKKVGVFPITDHYYEPLFNNKHLRYSLNNDRELSGISRNDAEQLSLLAQFQYQHELSLIPENNNNDLQFCFNNPSISGADAEYLYCMVRNFKPRNFIEIGSGYSTLLVKQAIEKNKQEDSLYNCNHISIEPYEMPWLEKTGIKVIRKLVEEVDLQFFKVLGTNDILFIDSSHIIRPQGDVLFEFLEILPSLNPGVIIHVHDIFTPRDYTHKHLVEDVLFWNEQYLLEAFLTCNDKFKIIAAVNYLKNHYPEEMKQKFPFFKNNLHHEPGSFWIKRVS